jgi:hypothetical protein
MFLTDEFRARASRSEYSHSAETMRALIRSLERDEAFDVNRLYAMDHRSFEQAIDLLRRWRLGRYLMLDSAVQAAAQSTP